MTEFSSSLLGHLEALRKALWRSVAAVALLLIPGFFAAPPLLELAVGYACPADFRLHYFSLMEPLLVQLKLGLLLAVCGALPVILWQLAEFVAPALYARERHVLAHACAAVFALFAAGGAMGFFLVVPLMVRFSVSMATPDLVPVIGYSSFVDLVALLVLSFGVMFQLPVVMVLLVRWGVVDVATLRRSRPLAVTVIFVLAAILTPPDVVSQLLLGVPSWLLFECALLVAGRSSGRKVEEEPEDMGCADRKPPEVRTPEEVESGEKKTSETALDDNYGAPYRQIARKNRRFGAINGHYRTGRGKKR